MDYSLFMGIFIGSLIPAVIIGVSASIAWLVMNDVNRKKYELVFQIAALCLGVCVAVCVMAMAAIGVVLQRQYLSSVSVP